MSVSDSVPTMPVERDVLAEVGGVDGDEDVARVHVGVEEAVAEHLREEDSTLARLRRFKSTPAALSSSMRPIGMPAMRSITSTSRSV